MSAPTSSAATTLDPNRWWTLGAVCTGIFMLLLDITIVNVALPDIATELDGTLSDLQWVIDAYALSLAALLLTMGSLADLFGRRRLFVIGLGLFTAGSTLCGLAPTILTLSLARAFQGIGGAAMFATGLALLSASFTGRERGTAFGLFGATTGIAVAIGPVLGGALVSGLSWRWIFWVNIPLCLGAIAIAVRKVTESKAPHAGRPDWWGFATFSAGLGLLVYGLIRAGDDGWGDAGVVACLLGSAVLIAAFVVVQTRVRHPMFDLTLLRKPSFVGGLVAAFGISASIFSLITYLVIYLQNVLGFSPVGTGLRLLFLSAASFVAATIAGRLTARVSTRLLIGPGFLMLSVGLALLLLLSPTSGWTALIPGLLVSGVAIGFINVPLASTAVGVVTPDRSGMASGVNSTFRQVGIATGIAALGSIFSHQLSANIGSALTGTPAAGQADGLAGATIGGALDTVLASVPGSAATAIRDAATAGYVDAFGLITIIAATLAGLAGVLCLILIRQRDFLTQPSR